MRVFACSFLLAASIVSLMTVTPVRAAPSAATPKPLSPMQKEELQDQLKSSVSEEQAKLGLVEAWQKKIFNEEVLIDYARFIKGYRSAGNVTTVDVDHDSLKKYLSFYAPKYYGKSDLKALVYVAGDPECAKCQASLTAIRKAIKSRLERRGLAVVFMTTPVGQPFVLATELEKIKDSVGIVQIRAKQMSDEEHPEEEHYLLSVQAAFTGPQGAGLVTGKEIKTEKQLDVLKNDSFETAASRLFIDSATELGSQSMVVDNTTDEEILLLFSGIKDFQRMIQIKTALNDTLSGSGIAEERRISHDEVTLAVRTKKSADELKKLLNGMSSETIHLKLGESTDRQIKVEVR